MKSKIIFATLLLFILINLAFVSATDSQTVDIATVNDDTITQDILTQENVESSHLQEESSSDYNLTSDNSNVEDTLQNNVQITENNRNDDILGNTENIASDETLGASTQSFTQLASKISSSGSTLKLTTDYKYNSNSDSQFNDGIKIHNSIKIDGQGHTIDGGGVASIFYIYDFQKDPEVTLININFINSGLTAVRYSGFSVGKIENCNFTNNSGVSGGALYSSYYCDVKNCNFFNNIGYQGGAIYAEDTFKMSDSVFVNNTVTNTNNEFGGAVFYTFTSISEAVSAEMTNCIFKQNFADYGGAIYSRSALTLNNCEFIENRALEKYGAVYAWMDIVDTGSTFINNTAKTVAAIYADQYLTMTKSKFIGNHADQGCGALYVQFDAKFIECMFINNTANGDGGVGYLNRNAEVTKCTFINNTAKTNGGTLVVKGVGRFTDCNFTHNEATDVGGALDIRDNGYATNCMFIDNHVIGSGGAINYGKMGDSINCTFINNTATKNGGALNVQGWGSMKNCTFISNSADGEGGAVILKSTGDSTNTKFIENTAEIGGAISVYSAITMANSTFENNVATTGINNIALRNSATITQTNSTPNKLGPFRILKFNVTAIITNVIYGNPEQITVDLISEGPKINNDIVYVVINDKNYTAQVIDGTAILNINGLEVGSYSVYIMDTDENYTKPQLQVEFNVVKKSISFEVYNLTDIVYGEAENILISFDEEINDGNMSVIINNKEYLAEVINGTAMIEIPTPDADNYACYLVYSGKNYCCDLKPIRFNVAQRAVSIDVDADNCTYGETMKITVNIAGGNLVINEGDVIFTWGNAKYVKPVKNGSAIFELSKLNVGNYVMDVYFTGGNNFINQSTDVSFSIMKRDVSIIVESNNVTYGDKEVITISIVSGNEAITEGIVLFEIGNKQYMRVIDNETITFEFSNLDNGNYTCNVNYVGGNNYNDQVSTSMFNVKKRDVNFTVSILNITYGEVLKVAVNVTSDNVPVNEGNVTVVFSNTPYTKKVENGGVLIEIPNLNAGLFAGSIGFDAGDNYFKKMNIFSFSVSPADVNLTFKFTNVTYGEVLKIIVNVTSEMVCGGKVTVTVEGIGYTAEVVNGSAIVEIPDLDVGIYEGNIGFYAGDNFKQGIQLISFEVLQKPIDIDFNFQNISYGDVLKIVVNVTSDNAEVNEGNVTVSINNENYTAKVKNGVAIIEISNLNVGTYEGNVTFYAGDNYDTVVKSINLEVLKSNATISASNKAYVINYGGKYSVTINGVVGEKVTFTLNGKKIGSAVTNANGVATFTFTAKILKTAKAGTKNLIISLNNTNYQIDEKTVKITINKEKTKIKAKKKTFKKAKKVKKYKITLKNSKGKAVKKAKVTLKIKGKKFKAKTNKKGKAVFKIKKLTKKGKYKAKITFKGNKYYNKVTKKVKIKLK